MLLAYGKKGSRPGGSPNSLRNNEHSEKGTLAPRKPHIRRRLPQFSQGKSVQSEVVHFCRFGISHFFSEENVHSGVPFLAAPQYSLRKSAHYHSFSFIFFHFLSYSFFFHFYFHCFFHCFFLVFFFHVLACSCIFFSFSFIFFPSFFIFFHFLFFFHVLSFSFILLCFSFFSLFFFLFFLGCSKSFFFASIASRFPIKALM